MKTMWSVWGSVCVCEDPRIEKMIKGPGFKSWLCDTLNVWFWPRHVISLYLSFHIWKMGTMSLFSSSTAVVRMICNHKKHFLKYKEPHKYISFVLYFTVPTMKSVFSHNDNTNRNTLLTHYLIRSQTFFVPRLEAPKGRGCFVPCCSLNP